MNIARSWAPYAVLPLAIMSILPYSRLPTNTIVIWTLQGVILASFWLHSRAANFESRLEARTIDIYLIWNLVCIFRGLFEADGYWDWKNLAENSMAICLPVVAVAALDVQFVQRFLRVFLRVSIPLSVPLFILGSGRIGVDAYGFYFVPLTLLLVFMPALSWAWRLTLVLLASLCVFSDLGARSNVIKFAFPFVLLALYTLQALVSRNIFEHALRVTRNVLMLAPALFLVLGLTGTFNVFAIDEYVDNDLTTIEHTAYGTSETNLKADTRSFLYEEVLGSAIRNNYWLLGRTPARGNESESFLETDVTGRGERIANEASILNVFTWSGIVGLALYFLIFYRASYLALVVCRNDFSKMIGLFVAFHWSYSWVENFNNFSLPYVIIWIMVGLCFSRSFRSMSNAEVYSWVQSIFKIPARSVLPR